MSELLGALRLSGRTWCYADLAGAAGIAIAPADAVFVHLVIHGSVRLACAGGAQVELAAGDAVATLSGEAHALRTVSGACADPHDFLRNGRETDVPPSFVFGEGGRVGTRVLSGRLAAAWPAEVSRSGLPAIVRLSGSSAPANMLQPGALARAGMGPGSAALLTRLAEALLVAALRSDPDCRGFFSPEAQDPVDEALRLIAAAPSQAWTVESLARSVGMGRSNFAAQFTRRIGKAPMEVVAEHRMEQAASLLREGGLKLIEIAELAGYGSEAAFSRRFTRHFGETPSRYRELARRARAQVPVPAGFRPLRGPSPGATSAVLPRALTPAAPLPRELSERRRPGVLLRDPRSCRRGIPGLARSGRPIKPAGGVELVPPWRLRDQASPDKRRGTWRPPQSSSPRRKPRSRSSTPIPT